MISTLVTPRLMDVLIERKNLSIRNEGNVLLIEQINRYYVDGNFEEEVEKDGVVYTFYKLDNQIYVNWINRENVQEFINYEVAY